MNKIAKKILSVLSAATLLSLTACNNPDDISQDSGISQDSNISQDNGLGIPIKEVVDNYDEHFKNCKSKEYVNLDWTNTVKLQTLQFTECRNIEVFNKRDTVSNKEYLDSFIKYCKFYFGDTYDSNCLAFHSDGQFPEVTIEGNGQKYERSWVKDHIDAIENDNTLNVYDYEYINAERRQYLWGNRGYEPHWLDKGAAIELTGYNLRPTSITPSDMAYIYSPIELFYNDGTLDEKVYKLSDGEYSMGEAIDYFVNDYFPSQPYENIDEFSCYVSSVGAIKITDDLYFYLLYFSPKWNSISFESRGEFTSSGSNLTERYYARNGNVLMAKKNDVDIAYDFAPPFIREVGEPINKMLSLEMAADIASEKLSKAVKFEVRSADLIYSGPTDRETRVSHLKPTWKFTLINTNDDLYYNAYVDAVSGEFSYFSYSPI